jgi:hypothetical protein
MHPDGRAKGGEPCVKCSEPTPPNAHWKHRDRHVCSPRCNYNLNRQLNRLISKADADVDPYGRVLGSPTSLTNPRWSGPREFCTREGEDPPFEWEGFGVRPGDLVERYGIIVAYALLSRKTENVWPTWWPDHVLVAMEMQNGHQFIEGATADGGLTGLQIGHFTEKGERLNDHTFVSDGRVVRWHRELLRDVTDDGREFDWQARWRLRRTLRTKQKHGGRRLV